jgi:antitoxin ParD1/3/4
MMGDIERMTITLTAEMARAIKHAVKVGDYASSSEVVREALRDWQYKRRLREGELEQLRADVEAGLEDLKAGRVGDFDADRIVKKGTRRLAARESSG